MRTVAMQPPASPGQGLQRCLEKPPVTGDSTVLQLPSTLSSPSPPDPTARLVLTLCQNQSLTDCCHQSHTLESAEGGNVVHALVPKLRCLIAGTQHAVFIFCHLAELGISEGQPQNLCAPDWREHLPEGCKRGLHLTVPG